MYKYFEPNEYISLKPELVQMLDGARAIAGIPFVITSGFRTLAQNKAVGGVENSAHLSGEAADLRCRNSTDRIKIVEALLDIGFKRIGIGSDHIHCDISEARDQNVMWLE